MYRVKQKRKLRENKTEILKKAGAEAKSSVNLREVFRTKFKESASKVSSVID